MVASTWAKQATPVALNWTGVPEACPPRSFGMGKGAPTCPFTASAQVCATRAPGCWPRVGRELGACQARLVRVLVVCRP